MAKVLIYRPKSYWAFMALEWIVFLDGKRISTINKGQLLEIEITSGNHLLCCAAAYNISGSGAIYEDDDLKELKKDVFFGIDDFNFSIQKDETKIFSLRKNRLKIFIYFIFVYAMLALTVLCGLLYFNLSLSFIIIICFISTYLILFKLSKRLKIYTIKFVEKSKIWHQTFLQHHPETGELKTKNEKIKKSAGRVILEGSICCLLGIYLLYKSDLNEGKDFSFLAIITILYGARRIYIEIKKN